MNSTSKPATADTQAKVAASLRRRYWAERRFQTYGLAAIAFGLLCVLFLFGNIFYKGSSVLRQSYVTLDITYDAEVIDPSGARNRDELAAADYKALIRASLRKLFPDVTERADLRSLSSVVSNGAPFVLQKRVLENPALIGKTECVEMLLASDVDYLLKGKSKRSDPPDVRRVSDLELGWIDALQTQGRIALGFNRAFFTSGDSRDPEQAGVWGALIGSLLTLGVTLVLSFPIGVAAAIYLEEFAPRNRLTDVIEVNINNLAAVPSIVFGLLGLSVFINLFGMPRSATLVGGLVLTLLTLPTIIIASRAALKAVPPSIREAALGMGASRVQTIAHHVLPLAVPGMLTGAIIGMARALGETAPLLMIGMVAFIVEIPKNVFDPSTVLPVQIFLWSDSPERGFVERTSGAIIVLLLFLLIMNALAVFLRSRFERRW